MRFLKTFRIFGVVQKCQFRYSQLHSKSSFRLCTLTWDLFLFIEVKVIPQQAEVAQGVPGSLRPRIFLKLGTTRVVDRQPYASAAFTPGEIPGTHFQRLSRPQGTWFRRVEPRKKIPPPPGIDPGTVRLVAQCLNHYATPPGSLRVCSSKDKLSLKRKLSVLLLSADLIWNIPPPYLVTNTKFCIIRYL